MLVDLFDFSLPEELIAKYPLKVRTQSRLLCLDRQSGSVSHKNFTALEEFLQPGDLLVLNNSRVIPARMLGHKASGGKVEILVERIVNTQEILAHVKASKSPKTGTQIQVKNHNIEVLGRQDELFHLKFLSDDSALDIIETVGEMPLPPYMQRSAEENDTERYQTVYSDPKGSVAAPTAGLHFDTDFLNRLKEKGVNIEYVTLHVGAGTFQPVRCDNILEHKMHYERLTVSQKVVDAVTVAKNAGKRVIAVGTTSVRSLETAAQTGTLKPYEGESNLFIYPGYEFKCVDGLITNFHLPKSTLLMLVCAFAGRLETLAAYLEAIQQQYRFYSYGDAMFVV